MALPYQKQCFCGDKNFGFYWNETERVQNGRFLLGEFAIFVNHNQILKQDIVYSYNEMLLLLLLSHFSCV